MAREHSIRGFIAAARSRLVSWARWLQYLYEWHIYRRLHLKYAEIYRSRLNGVTFIGITGSAGKTAAETLIAAILASVGAVSHSRGGRNRLHQIARVVTATRPSDDFCVLEFGAEKPGGFDPVIRLARPTIGVVTTVGDDHHRAFGSREAIAAEKGKLIAALPPEGTAVLNADDPLVWAMGERCKARIVSYGLGEGADLQARDIRSSWPNRLSFTVRYRRQDYPVKTQLCGKHWVTSTLAALATGVAAGVPLAVAIKKVAQIPPVRARMEPVMTPEGITFLRDDRKAPFWGMPTVFEFLREAQAARKVLVLGTLAEYHGTARSQYKIIGKEALKVADVVIFVGESATYGSRVQKFAAKDQTLLAFPELREAAVALRELLRPGDLVLLKASARADHLGRLYHAFTGPVACWRMDCGLSWLCDYCRLLRPQPSAMELAKPDAIPLQIAGQAAPEIPRAAGACQVFIGFGNPGGRYRDTPHNIGFSVMDILAERHGLTFKGCGHAEVARLPLNGREILLVKPLNRVNNTGEVLLNLSQSMGFDMADCILVQDDIHLPAGTVRVRMKGGDGGHLGVRSVLVAFQTSDIRRVKIGVGSAENRLPPLDYVLSPLSPEVADQIKTACATAAERLLELASTNQN